MKIGQTLYVTDRRKWRTWLQKHFRSEKEIWLVYPNKASGKARITYNDAVEEALCFGWIDSIVKKVDAQRSAQRFSPRKNHATWSQPNRERLARLSRQGKIHASLRPAIEKILREKFVFPPDIITALKRNPAVWKHYQKFPPAYKRIRVAYIDGARSRPEEFTKRLKSFITKTEQNKRIGFGGIEKYYDLP
jgi:uncharacterized protein YdeI (YjbR/CyaY-like superfamily)